MSVPFLFRLFYSSTFLGSKEDKNIPEAALPFPILKHIYFAYVKNCTDSLFSFLYPFIEWTNSWYKVNSWQNQCEDHGQTVRGHLSMKSSMQCFETLSTFSQDALASVGYYFTWYYLLRCWIYLNIHLTFCKFAELNISQAWCPWCQPTTTS